MREARMTVAVLAVGLGLAASARAGVYSTDEIYPWPLPKTFQEFRLVHGDLAAAPSDRYLRAALAWMLTTADACPQAGPAPLRLLGSLPVSLAYLERPNRALYFLQRVTALEAKERDLLGLTVDERVNLSAYHIYLGQPEKAIRALQPALAEGPHFLVLANLATAYEMAQIPERALDYRRQALAAWPDIWPGWSTGQLRWYRKVETYHLNLLQARVAAAARSPRGGETLDPLFPRVQFIGPGGEYKAGVIAAEQWAEIPADALSVVTQLLFWLPNDNRLLWMLAELLNAQGDVISAATVFTDLVRNRNYTAPRELMRHYRVLMEARAAAEVFTPEVIHANRVELAWAVVPRGAGLAPGIGPLAQEAAWQAHLRYRDVLDNSRGSAGLTAGATDGAPPTAPAAAASWLPDWRHIPVAFVAGMIVMLLVQMQWREIRRRRQGMPVASRG